MNWHNLPGIKEREAKLVKINIKLANLESKYIKSLFFKHLWAR